MAKFQVRAVDKAMGGFEAFRSAPVDGKEAQ